MSLIPPLWQLDAGRFETSKILKKLASSSRKLAELKGAAASIPSQEILINSLGLQEAKDSSEIENIVTTHDELFKNHNLPDSFLSPSAKEVLRYSQALYTGFKLVKKSGILTSNDLVQIQSELVHNEVGFRKLPGTALKDGSGLTIYTPPQNYEEINSMMADLERFMNLPEIFDADPLIKMALIHHQFESIHPFYDGNGRTGRIINVLYLVKEGLLDIPVLYLSQQIVRSKAVYYDLLQKVRTQNLWEDWVFYMLEAVELSAINALKTVQAIKLAVMDYKHRIRDRHKFYSQDLINHLFVHPYTKIEFLQRDLNLSRMTATRYLDSLVEGGFLNKQTTGRSNYYINQALKEILVS